LTDKYPGVVGRWKVSTILSKHYAIHEIQHSTLIYSRTL